MFVMFILHGAILRPVERPVARLVPFRYFIASLADGGTPSDRVDHGPVASSPFPDPERRFRVLYLGVDMPENLPDHLAYNPGLEFGAEPEPQEPIKGRVRIRKKRG